ncbi:unnamed protein product [Spodoptera exigua]|nr:unnamed protein product [Spodoptera exigua]
MEHDTYDILTAEAIAFGEWLSREAVPALRPRTLSESRARARTLKETMDSCVDTVSVTAKPIFTIHEVFLDDILFIHVRFKIASIMIWVSNALCCRFCRYHQMTCTWSRQEAALVKYHQQKERESLLNP